LIVKPKQNILREIFAVITQTVLRGIEFEIMDSIELILDIRKFLIL
jgi:hypothetical protein